MNPRVGLSRLAAVSLTAALGWSCYAAKTGKEEDRYVFKVPSLRNVALTGPYFHDGSVASLVDAVRIMARFQLGRVLTDEAVDDIVAFLQSLSGAVPAHYSPPPTR